MDALGATITKLIIKSRIFASLANQSRKVKVPKVETEEGGTSYEKFSAVPKIKQKIALDKINHGRALGKKRKERKGRKKRKCTSTARLNRKGHET